MRIQMANRAFYAMFKTQTDRAEGYYFFEMEGGQWNIPELRKKLNEIVQKNKSFENCEITKVFPGVGQKTLLFNAMRMDQPDMKKNRILVVIQDMTSRAKQKKPKRKISK
jgi:hypothetical protein